VDFLSVGVVRGYCYVDAEDGGYAMNHVVVHPVIVRFLV